MCVEVAGRRPSIPHENSRQCTTRHIGSVPVRRSFCCAVFNGWRHECMHLVVPLRLSTLPDSANGRSDLSHLPKTCCCAIAGQGHQTPPFHSRHHPDAPGQARGVVLHRQGTESSAEERRSNVCKLCFSHVIFFDHCFPSSPLHTRRTDACSDNPPRG